MKEKIVYKMEPLEMYAIRSQNGFIHMDEEGKWWFGGSSKTVRLALFKSYQSANRFRNKIKKQNKALVGWTKIVYVGKVERSKQKGG